MLSLAHWKETASFKKACNESQIEYYRRMNAPPEVMKLVEMESKAFGTRSEHILREILDLGQRSSPQHDATLNDIKIEIKCARIWKGENGKNDCKWQHLQPEHDYQYLLVAMLCTNGTWELWGVGKEVLMGEMRDKKILQRQGTQGWWFFKNSGLSYLTPIHSRDDLLRAISVQ
jgi:hypothetical protein